MARLARAPKMALQDMNRAVHKDVADESMSTVSIPWHVSGTVPPRTDRETNPLNLNSRWARDVFKWGGHHYIHRVRPRAIVSSSLAPYFLLLWYLAMELKCYQHVSYPRPVRRVASRRGPRGQQGCAESRRGQYREPFCVMSGRTTAAARPPGMRRPGPRGRQRVWMTSTPVGLMLSPVLPSLPYHISSKGTQKYCCADTVFKVRGFARC